MDSNLNSTPSTPIPSVTMPTPEVKPVVSMAQSVGATPIKPLPMPKSNEGKGMMVLMGVAIICLVAIVAVLAVLVITNNRNNAALNTTETPVSTVTNTITKTVEVVPTYKQVVASGFEVQTDTASGVSFALPKQDSYGVVPYVAGTSVSNAAFRWYVSSHTGTDYLTNDSQTTLDIYRTPGGYGRDNFGCGIGCAKESFVLVTYKPNTKTIDQYFEDYKAALVASDAQMNAQNQQAGGSNSYTFKSLLEYTHVNKWGKDVIQYRLSASGDNPERNRYMYTDGKMIYFVDFFETEPSAESMAVFDSLAFN